MRRMIVLIAMATAILVAGGISLVAMQEPAEATFPGENGKMAFSSNTTVGEGVDNPERDYEIFTVDPNGTDLTQLTHNATKDDNPAFSADGTMIAYEGFDGSDYEIYTVSVSGGAPTQVTDNSERDYDPSFSADGSEIAYVGVTLVNENPMRVREIYTVPSSGGTPTVVVGSNADTEYYGPSDPDWSPDGSKIAYSWSSQGGEGSAVMDVINLTDGTHTDVVQNSPLFSEWNPDWSPDGSKIAFSGYSLDPESYEIYTVPAAGGTPVVLTDTPDRAEEPPIWSPDGSQIAFVDWTRYGSCYGSAFVNAIPSDGGAAAKVTDLPGQVSSLDWGTAPQTADPPDPPPPAPDNTPPTVVCTVPAEGSYYAKSFVPDSDIQADFSEEMDPATIDTSTFFLAEEGSGEIVEASVVCEGDPCRTARLDPTAALGSSTTYTATIKSGDNGVKDPAGNALAADKTWSITTRDATSPNVSITAPAEGATVSGSEVTISAEASDNTEMRYVAFYVNDRYIDSDYSAGGESGDEYSVSWDSTRVPYGQQTIEARAYDREYNQATATTTVTVDNVPDPPTDTTSPRVEDTQPDHREEDVSRAIVVSATFSEQMDSGTLGAATVRMLDTRSGRRVAATVECNDPCTRIELDPSNRLAANARYRVTVTPGAEDLAGNALDQEPDVAGVQKMTWVFTTGTWRSSQWDNSR